jgi:hypothetical protein
MKNQTRYLIVIALWRISYLTSFRVAFKSLPLRLNLFVAVVQVWNASHPRLFSAFDLR